MDIVEECRASLSLKYNAREVVWSVDIDRELTLVADRFHLAGIVSALLDNATKYSPESTEVDIRAKAWDDSVVLEIADRGLGIARSEQRRIFDKFYRVTSGDRYATSGYGIGLYYVQSVVKRHGG